MDHITKTCRLTVSSLRNSGRIKDSLKLNEYISEIQKADARKSHIVEQYVELATALSANPTSEPLTLESIELLDIGAKALYMNSNQIVNYLRLLDADSHWKVEESVFKQIVPAEFERPPKLDTSKFGYDELTDRFIRPKIRYIANSSAFEARDTLLSKDPKITENVVLSGHSRMFKLLGSQERLGNAEMQIAMVLFSKQEKSEEEIGISTNTPYQHGPHKFGKDLVGIQAIKYLLRDRYLFPYTTSSGRLYVNDNELDFSCTLPQVIIVLLNIATMELLGNYTNEFALLAVEYMFSKCSVSICTEYLEKASTLRDLDRWLYLMIPDCTSIVRNKDGTPMLKESLLDFKDWGYIDKHKEMTKTISTLKGIELKVWRYITSHLTGTGSIRSLRIRYLKMLLHGITSPAIYNKTSLLLEYEKSAAPVLKRTIPYPKITKKMYDADGNPWAIQYDWNESIPLISGVNRVFNNKYHRKIATALLHKDFEREFTEALTNKSDGIKIEDSTLPLRLQNVSNTRVIKLAIKPEAMTDYLQVIENLQMGGKCTVRFQIKRRGRLVWMVIQQKQAQQIVNLRGFEELKRLSKVIVVGDQKGDIRNCALQLHGSSGTHGINNSSDMKGQDAHTMPIISDFIDSIFCETIIDNRSSRYFCMNEDKVLVSDNITNDPLSIRLSPVYKYCVAIQKEGRPVRYEIRDEYFKMRTPQVASDFPLASGLYGTTAVHSTILGLNHEAVLEEFNAIPRKEGKVDSDANCLGDDFYELLQGNEETIADYLEFNRLRFEDANFEVEAEVSKVFATFLQNDCLLGMSVPKPERMSLYCEEKNEVRQREKLDIVKNLISLGRIFSQRTLSNNNIRSLVMSGWNLLRTISYSVYDDDINTVRRLASRSIFGKWLEFKFNLNRLEIILPYLSVCLPPISFPLPPIEYNNVLMPGTAMTSPYGDVNWLHLRQLFDTDPDYSVKNNLLTINKNPTRLDQIWKRPSKYVDYEGMNKFGIQFGHYFIKFRRTEILESKRSDDITQLYKHQMISYYKTFQDPSRQFASYNAYVEFGRRDIKVSKRLAYFSRPEKKIEDALVAREQNLSERSFIDRSLFIYLSRYKGNLGFEVKEMFDSFSFCMSEDYDYPMPNSTDFDIVGNLSSLPSYHQNDDFGKAYVRFGGVARFSHLNFKEYQSLMKALDGIGGADIVISESRKVLTRFKDKSLGLALLMDYFAIPNQLFSMFQKIVLEDARMYFYTPYQSYFESQAFMDLDTGLSQVDRMIAVSTFLADGYYRRLKRFLFVTSTHVRDLIQSMVSTMSFSPCYKVIVKCKPYSYARFTQFTKLDPAFSKRALQAL